jgi:hypothetical protein
VVALDHMAELVLRLAANVADASDTTARMRSGAMSAASEVLNSSIQSRQS